MRLVIDGRRLTSSRTGVGRYLESLLIEWASSGLPAAEVVVVVREPAGLARIPRAPGLRAIARGGRWPGLAWEWFALGRVLRPGDLLFAPTNLVPANWRGPAVVTILDTIQEALPQTFPWHVRWRFGWRYRQAARRADRILVPSHATAADVQRFFGVSAEQIRVIPLGIGPEFQPLAGDDPRCRDARRAVGLNDEPYFLFVGKPSQRRHVPETIAGFELYRRHYPECRLVFVGPAQPERFSAGQHVRYAGHVPDPTLQGLLAGAEALLYPSDYEGFGLPVVEAMACGCPVVTLRNSAMIEAGGDAAFFIDAPEPAALAQAMQALSCDREARARHVARGLDHAARFSRARFATEVKAELVRVADRLSAGATRAATGAAGAASSASRSRPSTDPGRGSPGRGSARAGPRPAGGCSDTERPAS